jgi:hypothetical protein
MSNRIKCSIYAYCPHCFDVHPLDFQIVAHSEEINHISGKTSLNDVFHGIDIPNNFVFSGNEFYCPKSNKKYYQKDNSQIFIVPEEPLKPAS